jgi:LmbE family N-acetylglucosaminyl deacetylase
VSQSSSLTKSILSYGTLRKLQAENNKILLVCMCGLGRKTIDNSQRLNIYKSLGFDEIILNYNDLSLTKTICDNEISKIILKFKPDVIVTHSNADLHFEHRIVFDSVLLNSRSCISSNIKEVWSAISQTKALAYNQYGIFNSNLFINVSKYINDKQTKLIEYEKINELPNSIYDIRSPFNVILNNNNIGHSIGVDYAECYQQIFKIVK